MNLTESCDDFLNFKQEELADTTPLARTIGYLGLIAILTACPAFWIYFVYNRVTTNAPRLTKRSLTMLTTFVLGMMILSGTISLNNIVGNENFECRLFSLLTMAGFQLILLSFVMRVVAYVNRIKFNEALINTKMKHLALNGYVLQGDFTTKQKLEAEANGRRNSLLSEFVPPGYCQPLKNCIMSLFCWTQPPSVPASLQFSLFLSSTRYLNAAFFLLNALFGFLLINLIYSDSYLPSELECFGCAVEQGSGFFVISLGVLLVCALMLFFLRRYPDSLGVKKEIYFFVFVIVFFHTLIIELPVEAIPALKELDEERKFDFTNLFLVLEAIVVIFHQLPYQVFLSKRVDGDDINEVKQPMEVFIQDNKRARPFLLYLSHCLATENLLFVKAVEAWKSDFDLFTPEKKKQRADNVVAQFIARDAYNHINIGGHMAKGIIERVQKDNLAIDMLDEALNEILVMLRPLYKKFHDSGYNKAMKGELAEVDIDTLELNE